MSQHLREGWAGLQATAAKTYYHGSGAALAVGEHLRADGGNYSPGAYTDQGAIYVTDHPDLAFFYAVFGPFSSADFSARPHVYEVSVVDPRPARPGEWTVSEATVVREVTAEARIAFADQWEGLWKPMIQEAHSGGMPTPTMIVHEFETRLR